jgi:hypothetical protein
MRVVTLGGGGFCARRPAHIPNTPLLTFESSSTKVHHQLYKAIISSHNCERWRLWGHSNVGTQCSKHEHDLIILSFLIISHLRLGPMAISGTWFSSGTPSYASVVNHNQRSSSFKGCLCYEKTILYTLDKTLLVLVQHAIWLCFGGPIRDFILEYMNALWTKNSPLKSYLSNASKYIKQNIANQILVIISSSNNSDYMEHQIQYNLKYLKKIWHYYNTPLYQRSVTLSSNGQMTHHCCPIATVMSQ